MLLFSLLTRRFYSLVIIYTIVMVQQSTAAEKTIINTVSEGSLSKIALASLFLLILGEDK